MKQQIKLININKTKTAVGLLSGTSIDGIDAVLIRIKGAGTNIRLKVIDFLTYPISSEVKRLILKNSYDDSSHVSEICRLNVLLGKLFSDAVIRISRRNSLIKNGKINIDFIGSHGQTIHHLPDKKMFAGYSMKSTLQIGDPSVIANLTGVATVGDFRVADCAVGGDGAPLVPYLDYILFRSEKINRGLLNIGGISNITVIPKGAGKDEVFAFDTGPGNMLIDGLMKRLYNKSHDKDSGTALKGKVNKKLFEYLKKDRYYTKQPPKSTGRELYGEEFQSELLKKYSTVPKADLIRTVTEFTPFVIWYNYVKYIKPKVRLDELIISGGGSNNPLLMELLDEYFEGVKIRKINSFGISADSKEAVLFAVLANECLAGMSANMPNATGSARNVILGKICLAYNK